MRKFALLLAHLQTLEIATKESVIRPGSARRDVLELAHCSDYLDRFISGQLSDKEIRRLGLPWSKELLKRTLISPNGTLLTANMAIKHGLACHLAGGTHHAHYDFASGYCVLNDLAIAALTLLRQGKIKRALIFDCDVHQGDGTATILADTDEITTCSIHCEKNFPHRKATSNIDVEVAPQTADKAYLHIVGETLLHALSVSQPDLVIFDAGVDVYENDPLGMLNISVEGIRRRDAMVIKTIRDRGIPLATVIGGGYDKDQTALAQRHAIVVEEAFAYQNSEPR